MGAYLQCGEFMQMGIFGLGTGMVSLGRGLVAGVTLALYLPVKVVVGPKFIFYSAFRRISPPLTARLDTETLIRLFYMLA